VEPGLLRGRGVRDPSSPIWTRSMRVPTVTHVPRARACLAESDRPVLQGMPSESAAVFLRDVPCVISSHRLPDMAGEVVGTRAHTARLAGSGRGCHRYGRYEPPEQPRPRENSKPGDLP
jgi:hypothetical protein